LRRAIPAAKVDGTSIAPRTTGTSSTAIEIFSQPGTGLAARRDRHFGQSGIRRLPVAARPQDTHGIESCGPSNVEKFIVVLLAYVAVRLALSSSKGLDYAGLA
jgi:hypothetical protein